MKPEVTIEFVWSVYVPFVMKYGTYDRADALRVAKKYGVKPTVMLMGGRNDFCKQDRARDDWETRKHVKEVMARRHLVNAIMEGKNIIWK